MNENKITNIFEGNLLMKIISKYQSLIKLSRLPGRELEKSEQMWVQ